MAASPLNKYLWLASIALCCAPMRGTAEPPAMIHVAVIGDSTVSDHPVSRGDTRGWGQVLPKYLDPSKAQVVNLAMAGRSSKSYIKEGAWDKVLKLSPNPQYVLIQFGHNDNPGKGNRSTSPGLVPAQLPVDGEGCDPCDWYRNNLQTYITQTRKMGAVPIVITPMERRLFLDGKLDCRNQLYADAAIAVCDKMKVQVIDLHAYSVQLYSKLGFEGSQFMHSHTKNGIVDCTHYSEAGAKVWAEFIVSQLQRTIPALKAATTLPQVKTIDQHLKLAGPDAIPPKATPPSNPTTMPKALAGCHPPADGCNV